MPTDWWIEWGKTYGDATFAAGQEFLASGNVGTPIGGTYCRSSTECASGYACIDGRCLPSYFGNSDGSNSGCGGSGGGGGGCFDGPTGCTTSSCGNGETVDCCGPRYCRFFQGGGVSCACGEPPATSCTVFCDAYSASFGLTGAGCEGKICDECASCDGNYFSSTYNTCIPQTGGPCHCDPSSLPECYKCNDQGTTELDLNCKQCVQIYNVECSCGKTIDNTCCYTLEDLTGLYGGDPVTRCQDETAVKCAQACEGEAPAEDPCKGECTTQKIGPLPGTCQDVTDQISVVDGHRVVGTGCIEAGGQATVLYDDCDMTNVPEECAVCDCNCNNDCPNCLLCGADGKCYPDPACTNKYFMEAAWRRQCTKWGRHRDAYPALGYCGTYFPECTNNPFTVTVHSGIVGQDPQGLAWIYGPKYYPTFESANCGSCEIQPAYSQYGAVVFPDVPWNGAYNIEVSRAICQDWSSGHRLWDTGVAVGYGNSLNEACLDIKANFPDLGGSSSIGGLPC